MNKDIQQLLRDPNCKPTENIIAVSLGSIYSVYIKFLEESKGHDITFMDWRYYNDGKAWLCKGEYKWVTSRGTNKVRPLFWLSIWNVFFKISFNFSEKTIEKLLALPLSREMKELIKNRQLNGDKMKFLSVIFDVDNEKQFDDILLLAQFRKENI